MAKRQPSLRKDETQTKKVDPTILVALIGGITTIIVALITVVIPLILKSQQDSPAQVNEVSLISTPSIQQVDNSLLMVANMYLNNIHPEYIDTFENSSVTDWSGYAGELLTDSHSLILTRTGRWNRNLYAGNSLLLNFKLKNASATQNSLVSFNNQSSRIPLFELNGETPNTYGYINIYEDLTVSIRYDDEYYDDTLGVMGLNPNKWYSLMLALDNIGNLMVVIWDSDSAPYPLRYSIEKLHDSSIAWLFSGSPTESYSTLYIDDFTMLSFDSFK